MTALGPVVLPGFLGVHELEVAGGRIAAIRPSEAGRGRLALPAFDDPHVHADRAYARGPRPPRSLADAVDLVRDVRLASSDETVRARAGRLLSSALRHGTLR